MRALLLENINQSAIDYFTKHNIKCIHLETSLSEDELIKHLENIDILGIRSKTHITKKIIDHAPSLKIIGCYCIGTNNVELNYCREKGIPVINSPYMNTRSVAELVICEIIGLSRKLGDKNMEIHNRTWNKSHVGCNEIRGKTLGIVGYGHVGSQLSILAQNIGMHVKYFDILNVLSLGNAEKCNSLKSLLQQSDYVSLHVPLTQETTHLIGDKELSYMKQGSYLLNLSRGKVVVVEDLRKHLLSGHLAGCALDVYPTEPKTNTKEFVNCLQKCPNTILTPHIGGATEEAQYNIGIDASQKILGYIKYGNSYESVNFPSIQIAHEKQKYLYIKNIHQNTPGVMSKINKIFLDNNINIVRQYIATKINIGFCVTIIKYNNLINKITDDIDTLEESIRTSFYY